MCSLFGVLPGILVAVGLSIADLLRRVAHPHDGILGFVAGVAGMHDIDDHPDARLVPGLVVYRYDSPLFFANAEDFRSRALAAASTGADADVEWFVLNAESNVVGRPHLARRVEELRAELARRGVVFAMARVKEDLRVRLEAAGLVERVGADRIFPTLPTAVNAYLEWYATEHGHRPARAAHPARAGAARAGSARDGPVIDVKPTVVAIHLAPGRRLPTRSVAHVEAEAGAGLVGDRYHGSRHRHVTLQSAADLEEAAADLGAPSTPA